jgi:hypothetical protein
LHFPPASPRPSPLDLPRPATTRVRLLYLPHAAIFLLHHSASPASARTPALPGSLGLCLGVPSGYSICLPAICRALVPLYIA